MNIPNIEAPWSRAAPVKLWTRCNKLSRDLAGLVGALTPRGGTAATVPAVAVAAAEVAVFLPKLNEKSGAAPWGCGGMTPAPGAGGGGIFGGPPPAAAATGFVGCSCMGRAAGGKSLGSISSCSEDKSPELNLFFFPNFFIIFVC